MKHRHEKREEYMKELAGIFIAKESNRQSLITVTRFSLSDHEDKALILISVLPETQEAAVIDFLTRNVSDFRKFVMSKIPTGKIPYFTFEIDKGEKIARKIDALSSSQ